jgi:predicted  nucleic acid-binding Zn-ribbon protein
MLTTAEIVHMTTLPPQAARAYMRECNMTIEDRERHLYITGRTAEAALIGQQLDDEFDALDEMRHECDQSKEEAARLEREADDLQAAAEAAEEKVLTLTSELENAQDEIKTLRTQIHEAGLDLV